jgi:hypothetical protein
MKKCIWRRRTKTEKEVDYKTIKLNTNANEKKKPNKPEWIQLCLFRILDDEKVQKFSNFECNTSRSEPWRFWGTYRLCLQPTLKMEELRSSEMSIGFQRTTEDSTLHKHHSENLKSGK